MKELNIVVAGTAAAGKTTIAEYIRQKLEEIGISVDLLDDNGSGIIEQSPEEVTESLNRRLASMASNKPAVRIRTAQTLRAR